MKIEQERVVPSAPSGLKAVLWMGPAIIWMASAIATGELLFTPRVASLYGYTVLWMLVLGIFFKAQLAREIGRYSVTTGSSILAGIRDLPGPRGWGVWFIVVPQLVVAASTITGLAGSAATALILLVPGGFRLWALVLLLLSVLLVSRGRYNAVERVSVVLSLAISAALIAAAAVVFPGIGVLASGLLPQFPSGIDFVEILPWIGFMMSGAAGLVWYSYWLPARGFGAAQSADGEQPQRTIEYDRVEVERLRGWDSVMKMSTITASALVFVLMVALLILGSELLRPRGLLPEGPAVTDVLSYLLGLIWGPVGRWALVLAAFFAFWGALVSNLDGWVRMLGEGSVLIVKQLGAQGRAVSGEFYRKLYLYGLMGVIPAALILVQLDPVKFLQLSGIIEAIHIPVVAFFTLYLNRHLPEGIAPSKTSTVLTVLVGVFFLLFAGFYLFTEFL
jgi:Mn2+/Fe2+ NRAMP family transporter